MNVRALLVLSVLLNVVLADFLSAIPLRCIRRDRVRKMKGIHLLYPDMGALLEGLKDLDILPISGGKRLHGKSVFSGLAQVVKQRGSHQGFSYSRVCSGDEGNFRESSRSHFQ